MPLKFDADGRCPRPKVKGDCKRCSKLYGEEGFTQFGELISPTLIRHVPGEDVNTACGISRGVDMWWWADI